MTRAEQKKKAQDLIMQQLSKIGYGEDYYEYADLFDSREEADACLSVQMDRVAKLFGFDKAWFS